MEKEAIREAMFRLMEQCQSSGKTNKQFYQENNLKPHIFYYWLSRYRNQIAPGGFAPLKLSKRKNGTHAQSGIEMEICYPNGTIIHLPAATSISTIRQLIRM